MEVHHIDRRGPSRIAFAPNRFSDVGDLSLSFNRLDIAADPGLTLFTYAAEPGTRSAEALASLGSWSATVDLADSVKTTKPD